MSKKTIVHVNQHAIRRNIRAEVLEPVLTVKTYNSNDYAFEVDIEGPCRVVYRPHAPLSCGARLWIETLADVSLKKSL